MRRSRNITLTMLASVSVMGMVTACGPEEPKVQDVQVTSAVYRNAEECKADGNTVEACNQLTQLISTAPKFNDQQSCEAQFGPNACAPQQNSGGGNSGFFGPMMMGYMLGSMGNGSSYNYGNDYNRYRSSPYYSRDLGRTQSGYYNQRASAPNVLAKPKALPVAAPASNRGGFGNSTRSKAMNSASARAINAGSGHKATTSRSMPSRGGFGGSARGHSGGG